MACDCSLEATAERLAGFLSDEDRKLLQELEHADPNGPLFEAHMRFEEDVLGPHMRQADRHKLLAQHVVIRAARARGVPVDPSFFQWHASWERQVFPTLGRRVGT